MLDTHSLSAVADQLVLAAYNLHYCNGVYKLRCATCAYTAAHVLKEFRTDEKMNVDVLGVTSVDDELFVLLGRADNQVAVYSINDYRLLRHLNLPGLEPQLYNDITSCVQHKCLYMSDNLNCCIHKYDASNTWTATWKWLLGTLVSKLLVPGKPCGLSVIPVSCNLLVTCQGESDKLVELCADSGQCVREIALWSDVVCPWHSVQLATGQLVVCHGMTNGLRRVCAVGDDGNVTYSYGGEKGSEVGQLKYPCHLAVDKDSQFIFVADWINDRVVLLSPTLEFVRYVIEERSRPYRLHFHQATRRLVVGQQRGQGVIVIQL